MGKRNFDINCDLAEHGLDGIEKRDKLILVHLDACNIAVGGHAGDDKTISKMISYAQALGVKIGIHPSYPDRANFGRKEMDISLQQLRESLENQINNFIAIAKKSDVKINHIKAHGALYNRLADDLELADMFCDLILEINPKLIVYGLADSPFIQFAKAKGLGVYAEAFMDRLYTADLRLVSRSLPNAVHNKLKTINQYKSMTNDNVVVCDDGVTRKISFDTICLHGDGDEVLEVMKYLE